MYFGQGGWHAILKLDVHQGGAVVGAGRSSVHEMVTWILDIWIYDLVGVL